MGSLLPKHKLLLYRLKREFGKRVAIYRPIASSQNVQTGKIIRGFQLLVIRLAPVLPRNTDRRFAYDLDYIQAGNNFTEGAFYDRSTSEVLIDVRDLPKGFEPNLDDFLVFEYKRFDIKKVARYEDLATFRLDISAVENQAKEKWVDFSSCIGLTAEAESV